MTTGLIKPGGFNCRAWQLRSCLLRGFGMIGLEFLGDRTQPFQRHGCFVWEKAPRSPFHVGACTSPSLITVGKVPRSDVGREAGSPPLAIRSPHLYNPGSLNNL